MQGQIVKAIAGFYYVFTEGSGIYMCRARGIFRKEGITPLVGDRAEFEITDPKDMEGNVTKILPRKNMLGRPACANIDLVLITAAQEHPRISLLVIDRLLLQAEKAGIPAAVVINKADTGRLAETDLAAEVYPHCGYPVYLTSTVTGEGIDRLREAVKGKTAVFAGASGVGKSSLLNALCGSKIMETGAISKKLMRGKNTTRHTELSVLPQGGSLLDTPGFSAFSEEMLPEDLAALFPEMRPHLGKCYFQGCAHISEPDCAVRSALEEGTIAAFRYENYKTLYEEAKEQQKRRYQ